MIKPQYLDECSNASRHGVCVGCGKALPEVQHDSNSINRQAAIDAAKDVCQTVLAGCKSHYDLELGDDIYDDINEIAVVLRYNKAILEALNKLPAVPDRVNQKSSHGCHYQNHGKEIPGNETSNI